MGSKNGTKREALLMKKMEEQNFAPKAGGKKKRHALKAVAGAVCTAAAIWAIWKLPAAQAEKNMDDIKNWG